MAIFKILFFCLLVSLVIFISPPFSYASIDNFSVVEKDSRGKLREIETPPISSSVGNLNAETKFLVKLKNKPTAGKIRSVMSRMKGAKLAGGIANTDFLIVKSTDDTQKTLTEIKSNSEVETVIKMPRVKATRTPNDEFFSLQWGFSRMNVPAAWDNISEVGNATAAIKVAVVDSGVDRAHPDLAGKIDPAEWVSCNDTNCTRNDSGTDASGHGTHVAGIIGAVTDNTTGVAGVGWGVKLISVQVLDSLGSGSLDTTLNGITYAAEHGAKVINMSLGVLEGDLDTQAIALIQQVIDNAWSKGAVLIAAAGNCGKADTTGNPECILSTGVYVSNTKSYPAASRNVISVTSSTSGNQLSDFSEHNNSSANCQPNDTRSECWVSVAAPGGQSSSNCDPNQDGVNCILSTFNNSKYALGTGTSMAAPHVAGLAALILAKNGNLTNSQVKTIIETTANENVLGKVTNNGLVDALSALNASSNPPTSTPVATTNVPTATSVPTSTGAPTTTSAPTSTNPTPTGAVYLTATLVPTSSSPTSTFVPTKIPALSITPYPLDEPQLIKVRPDPFPPAPYCPISSPQDCCSPQKLSAGFKCVQNCGPPVTNQDDPTPGYSCLSSSEFASREKYGCPICLSLNTKISTPMGEISIKDLKAGMSVYSKDLKGNKIRASILKIGSTEVPKTHKIVHLVLEDGRSLDVSPGHPTESGEGVEKLKIGKPYDGSIVISNKLVLYDEGKTYDLLPDGPTGLYWANRILMSSTLNKK